MDNPQYEGGAAMPTTEKGIGSRLVSAGPTAAETLRAEINERHDARERLEGERGEDD